MPDVDTDVKTGGNSLAVRLPCTARFARTASEPATGPACGSRRRARGVANRFRTRGAPADVEAIKDAERRRERARDARREKALGAPSRARR